MSSSLLDFSTFKQIAITECSVNYDGVVVVTKEYCPMPTSHSLIFAGLAASLFFCFHTLEKTLFRVASITGRSDGKIKNFAY